MFVDTSGFLCRFVESEVFNQQAVELFDSAHHRITTNYVLAEYTALAQIRGLVRQQIIDFSEQMLQRNEIEVVWIDEGLHTAAVRLMRERFDKSYSLCDAVSFVLMRGREITDALTTDQALRAGRVC